MFLGYMHQFRLVALFFIHRVLIFVGDVVIPGAEASQDDRWLFCRQTTREQVEEQIQERPAM